MAQAHTLTLESQELGTVAVDRGSQCSPTCQILEGGDIRKAGGASGHSTVLAVTDLWAGQSRVRADSQAGPKSVVAQAGSGGPGVSAMWGREAGGPRARVGPAWSGGRAAARGKGSVCEQPGQQRGLGRDSWEPGAGDTLPWGVCSPTPSNRRQLRAGGRGAAVSGAGGVLTCWAPKLTSRGGEAHPDPVMSPGHPAATTLWPALGTPSSSQPGGTPQSSLPCREPPPHNKRPRPQLGEGMQRKQIGRRREEPQPRPESGRKGAPE